MNSAYWCEGSQRTGSLIIGKRVGVRTIYYRCDDDDRCQHGPDGSALALLRVAAHNPAIVVEAHNVPFRPLRATCVRQWVKAPGNLTSECTA